jgi:DNA-binding Lrp family transcriptional regulator
MWLPTASASILQQSYISQGIRDIRREGSAMTTRAYICIETAVGKTRKVVPAIQKCEGVVSADELTGPYDIVAIVEGTDLNAIGSIVAGTIHGIPGITKTVTCVATKLS